MISLDTISSLLVLLFISASVYTLNKIVPIEYKIQRNKSIEQNKDIEEWYDESVVAALEVQRLWESKFQESRSPVYSEIQAEMNLLSGKIDRHASKGEQLNVDEDVLKALYETSSKCRRIYDFTVAMDNIDQFQELGNMAVQAAEQLQKNANNQK